MDPLSIIASIAGIATAGTELSKAIFHFISATRGASREMVDIARTLSDLSFILGELRRVLQDNADLCSRRLLRHIKSSIRRIAKIHKEIHTLMDGIKGFQTFKWTLKRSEVQYKLTRIETHKTGIHLMLNILILAAATRKEKQVEGDKQNQRNEQVSEVSLLRQQSENLTFAASQSLIDLTGYQDPEADCHTMRPKDTSTDSGGNSQLQAWTSSQSSDDTAHWLYDLAFRAYTQSREESNTRSPDSSSYKSKDLSVNEEAADSPSDSNDGTMGQALAIRNPSELQMAIWEPGAGATLVDELLADWTKLTEEEITGNPTNKADPERKEAKVSDNTPRRDQCLYFKDAVGRDFCFPFHLVETWQGMEDLINQSFEHIDTIGPYVKHGYYNLFNNDGIILPRAWEANIEPGMHITMCIGSREPKPPPQQPSGPARQQALPKREDLPQRHGGRKHRKTDRPPNQ